MTTPRAILIDLDDTLIDFTSDTESSWRVVCGEAGEHIPGLDAGQLYEAITHTRDWYWSDPERHRKGRADLVAASQSIVQMRA